MTFSSWRKQLASIRELAGERINNIAAYFITTRSSSRANRNAQIFRLSLVLRRQTVHRHDPNTSQGSAPACMYSRESAGLWISNEKRYTISRLDPSQHSFCVADDRVAIDRVAAFVLGRLCFSSILDNTYIGAVNLPTTCQGPVPRKKLEKATAILQNVLRFVVVESGKTKRVLR